MNDRDFIAYEYRSVSAKAEDKARTADMYEAFGWEVTGETAGAGGVILSMRRDRRTEHKQELTRLERKAEEQAAALRRLKASQTSGARVFAYIFGVIAALVLGGGMALAMTLSGNTAAFVAGIIVGCVGIVMCAVTYPIYRKLADGATKRTLPAIDDGEEKLANLLEQGDELLRMR